MSARRAVRLAVLATVMLPSVALADHPFILPSATSLSGGGNTVTFDAAASDHLFFFDHRPIAPDTIKAWKPDGTPAEPLAPTRTRFRSVFDLRLDQPGTWKVASQQTTVGGTLMLNGELRRVGGRGGPPPGGSQGGPEGGDGDRARRDDRTPGSGAARGPGENGGGAEGGQRRQPPIALADIPSGATDIHLVQTIATTETFVTAGAPTVAVFKPTGTGLECVPITHPNALAAGQTARFRFLIDGRPAAGITISVIQGGDRYRDEVGYRVLTTAADGTVAITWPAAGMYWVGAEAEDSHPSDPRAQTRRLTYAATLEVMTP